MSLLISAPNTTLSVFSSPNVKSPSAVIAPVACKLPFIKTSLLNLMSSLIVAASKIKAPAVLLITLFSIWTSPTSKVVPKMLVLLVVPFTSSV